MDWNNIIIAAKDMHQSQQQSPHKQTLEIQQINSGRLSLSELLDRPRQPLAGKIAYDWKKAEEGLVARALKGLSPQQNKQLSGSIVAYLQLCQEKFIPDFYIFASLASVLLPNATSALIYLEEQIKKVREGDSEYQEISMQLTLQQSLISKIVQRQRAKEDCLEVIEQLRQVHTLSVLKIGNWEQKMAKVLGYPVFFHWNSHNYLLALHQMKTKDSQILEYQQEGHSGIRTHIQTHELYMNTRSKDDQGLESKCLSIIKAAKAKQLELILNHPNYTSVRQAKPKEYSNGQEGSPNVGYLKSKVSRLVSKSNPSLALAKKFSLQDLGADELAVIKRFRSYKKLNAAPRRRAQSEKEAVMHPADTKLRDKLAILKQKVKDRSQHSRQIRIQQVKPTEKSIRLICEQQIDISDNNNPSKKHAILNSLSLAESPLRHTTKNQLRRSRIESATKVAKLEGEMLKLAEINRKKKEQMENKNKNLETLKQQLTQKVKKGYSNSPVKQHVLQIQSLKKIPSKPVIQPKIEENQELRKERELRQKRQKELLEAKNTANSIVSKIKQEFIEFTSEKQRNQQLLREKRQRVERLNEKIQLTSQPQKKQLSQMEQEDTLFQQVQALKKKKQMEYEYQKQKINQVGATLEERVKEQQLKYEQLKEQEERKERELKEKLQKEVETIRKAMEKEAALIKSQIETEEKRRKQYEEKIEREKAQNDKMMEQLRQWSQKEQQLLLMLEQEKRKRAQKEEQAIARRKAAVEAELLQMERKEEEIVKGYRSANRNLVSMLDILKHKNYELEQKVSKVSDSAL